MNLFKQGNYPDILTAAPVWSTAKAILPIHKVIPFFICSPEPPENLSDSENYIPKDLVPYSSLEEATLPIFQKEDRSETASSSPLLFLCFTQGSKNHLIA